MSRVHYVNLSSGIEWVPVLLAEGADVRYVRIQSTWCEQKRWGDILLQLGDDFLMNLALGRRCVVYDASKSPPSRALWQGVPWVRFALTARWFGRVEPVLMRNGIECSGYFGECLVGLDRKVKRKVDYFRKFLDTDGVRLWTKCMQTENDGRYAVLRERLLREACTKCISVK
jgi:hypothetical protein